MNELLTTNKKEIFKIKEDFADTVEPIINQMKWAIKLHGLIKCRNKKLINEFTSDQLRSVGKEILNLRQFLQLDLPNDLPKLLRDNKSVENFERYFNQIVDKENEVAVKQQLETK